MGSSFYLKLLVADLERKNVSLRKCKSRRSHQRWTVQRSHAAWRPRGAPQRMDFLQSAKAREFIKHKSSGCLTDWRESSFHTPTNTSYSTKRFVSGAVPGACHPQRGPPFQRWQSWWEPWTFQTALSSFYYWHVFRPGVKCEKHSGQQCKTTTKPRFVNQSVTIPAVWKLDPVWLNTGWWSWQHHHQDRRWTHSHSLTALPSCIDPGLSTRTPSLAPPGDTIVPLTEQEHRHTHIHTHTWSRWFK